MILKLAWKNIWRNRRRTIITISAIAFAVLFATSMRSMRSGMEEQLLSSIVENNSGYLQVQAKDFWDEQTLDNGFYSEDVPLDEIRSLKTITEVDKKLEAGTLSSTGMHSRGTYIMSYDQSKEIPDKISNNIIEGKFPVEGSQEILLGEELSEYLEVGIGDTVVFLGQGYHGATAAGLYVLSGIVDMKIPELNRVVAYMPMKDLQNHLSAPGLITALMIDIKDPDKVEKVKAEIESIVGNDYRVMTWYEMNPELKQMLDANDAEGMIMSGILYMIITFVLFGTILMATQERKYELGVLVAIGMKKWKSMLMIFYENVFISLMGAIVGIIIVAPVVSYLHFNPIRLSGEMAEMMEGYGFEAVIPFSIDPQIAINHASIVACIAIVLLIYPMVVIKRLKPVDAMKV